MGKSKHRQCARSGNSRAFAESDPDLEMHGENGWVIVKKQKVTILVPSLPAIDKSQEPRQSEETKMTLKTLGRMTRINGRMTIPPLGRKGVEVSQGLRAVNLERKLKRAGGLSRWLVSLGLHQFARLFQRKGLGKFHLVNLTMKKLKEMGANAVGPRRKLMHAIDCICHPHCYAAAF